MKSVFIRKRGKKFYVYLEYIDPITQKRKQKNQGTFDKKKEAQNKLIEIKHSIVTDRFILPSQLTFVGYMADYIRSNEGDWSPHTVKNYKFMLEKVFKPYFQDLEIQKVSPLILQNFYDEKASTSSLKTIKVYHAMVNSTLKKAYRLKLIDYNPCDFIELPKKKDRFQSSVYDKDEVKNLIKLLEGHILEIPILLALTLGLRVSEVCGLTWDNINFDNNTLTVDKIMYKEKGKITFKEPKTATSKRIISMPIEMSMKLKKLKKYQLEQTLKGKLVNKYNLVNFNKSLDPFTPNYLSRSFKKLLETNNLKHIRFHDLRHTNATLMLLSGTDMKVASKRLGHSSIKITLDTYAHVLNELDVTASDNLSEVIFK